MIRFVIPLLSAACAAISCAFAADSVDVSIAKPWTRWWWPGSAVDEENITRELEAFAAAGLGGVEITPIYGARGYEQRYVDFLSPRWMELLEHTAREGRRLGLGVDMATGTGWPFGGPWVGVEDGSHKLVFANGRLGGEPTNMQVKRAAPGNEGRVLDPYSPAALGRYLGAFDTAFSNFPRGLIRAQFHDSFEYYDSGWTPELPEVFRELHGYNIQDHAAALVGQAPVDEDTLRRLKSDYRSTLAKLHLDYLRTWSAWSREHGFIVRNQSHGAPANLLDLYGAVDIPETETYGSTPFPIPGLRRDPADVRSDQDLPDSLMIRMASSAAHVMGRPLTSSETCTWLREHWKVALSFTKPEIDRAFVDGINHIVYHGTCYSPEDASYPGWLFYASTQFNNRNSWWADFPALNAYVTRVQTVLQSGRPDNDVLLYWPFYDVIDHPDGLMKQYGVHDIDWLRDSPCGKLARMLTGKGFGWDYISDAQILETKVVDGALVTPGGARYRAIVIPATRRMPVATLEHLSGLQQQSDSVIFESVPDDVPGLGRLDVRRSRFNELADAMPHGHADFDAVVARLEKLGAVREPMVDSGLSYIRRETKYGEFSYFVANQTGESVVGWKELGKNPSGAEIVDPLTGIASEGRLRRNASNEMEIFIQVSPGESLIVHTYHSPKNENIELSPTLVPTDNPPLPVHGEWAVTFVEGGPELPAPLRTAELKSWTGFGEESARNFSGTARYGLEFALPADVKADDWLLDLGDVRESARVRVNGTLVATLWSVPFRTRIGSHLKPGKNLLEIDVTNLSANRIRDLDRRGVEWRIMREINFVNIHYRPFNASSWPLTPSGLLGPVSLTPLRTFDPENQR